MLIAGCSTTTACRLLTGWTSSTWDPRGPHLMAASQPNKLCQSRTHKCTVSRGGCVETRGFVRIISREESTVAVEDGLLRGEAELWRTRAQTEVSKIMYSSGIYTWQSRRSCTVVGQVHSWKLRGVVISYSFAFRASRHLKFSYKSFLPCTARVFRRDSPGKAVQWSDRSIRESWGVLWLVIRLPSERADVSSSVIKAVFLVQLGYLDVTVQEKLRSGWTGPFVKVKGCCD
jgi:hypothetical protein